MRRFIVSSLLLAGLPVALVGQGKPLPPPAVRQTAHTFQSSGFAAPVGYYLYLPAGYDQDSTAKFPLLVFLHGVGERGNGTIELPRVLKFGPPKLIERGRDYPFLVVTPQLPGN